MLEPADLAGSANLMIRGSNRLVVASRMLRWLGVGRAAFGGPSNRHCRKGASATRLGWEDQLALCRARAFLDATASFSAASDCPKPVRR